MYIYISKETSLKSLEAAEPLVIRRLKAAPESPEAFRWVFFLPLLSREWRNGINIV